MLKLCAIFKFTICIFFCIQFLECQVLRADEQIFWLSVSPQFYVNMDLKRESVLSFVQRRGDCATMLVFVNSVLKTINEMVRLLVKMKLRVKRK